MKIFLIGWFGAGNVGDEAILISELLALREIIAGVEFYILSFHPERTQRLTSHIPQVKKILRMGSKHHVIRSDLSNIMKTFREVDVVAIGGGGIFQDIYNHYPIPFFTSMALLARLYRKKLVLYCVGIGPINTSVGKRLCRIAANSAHLISVRDPESRNLLDSFGIRREVHLSADPVFLLEPVWNEKVEKVIETHTLNDGVPVIGVCVQDLLFWDDKNRIILADTLDTMAAERNARIVLLPLGKYRDGWFNKHTADTVDMAASKKLAALMRRPYSIITNDLTSQEILAVIKKMDLVISMRLHGLIMGLNMGVPAIALTYQEESKLRNLMKRVGQEEGVFDVRKLEKRKLLRRINYLLFEKNDVEKQLRSLVSSLREEAAKCNELLCKALIDDIPMAH